MKKETILILSILCATSTILSQTITIQPYLQDANPNSIFILWETDSQEESIVEWGNTEALGNETIGIAYTSNGAANIHEVHLENLERFTKYYYRVKTNNAISEIYNFKTPPFASDNEPFRILAMSDMQRDGSFPDKFQEIVEEGVLEFLEGEGELVENLALVMVPGDLVVNGNNFGSWKSEFFDPAEKLLPYIPVYPVLGNHENNASFYFSYFKLPENGTAGFEEHWWHKDYGNVRIIGLNSNGGFTGAEQLTWLDNVLSATCEADSIDFVFAELHHPHLSELWTPGESNFTGDVIERLENFTTNCDKPSIHFFGHTHGYSRGQSRDHKHLWINVATAGGAIDNWGEFPNFDYDEFTVSQDEYGFVMVEITSDDDPKVVVKRISRGDQDAIINNQLTDSLTIRLFPSIVNTPEAVSPINDIEIAPECVTLNAGNFSSPNSAATHGQSHWQVTTLQNGFDNPVAESWKNFENWYFDIDTQQGDDLTDEKMDGLEEFTDYIWRVRYRDREMNWSEWSTPATFKTGASIALPNLIVNPGAENDLNNWTTQQGVVEVLESGVCNGITPRSGNKYFAVGGLCDHSDVGIATQNVDISMYADSVITGFFPVVFGGYLSNFSGSDLPEMKVIFLDENQMELEQSNTLSTLNNSWTLLSESMIIPAETRSIQVELRGTRNSGTDNDSYFDDLFLTLGTPPNPNCNIISSTKYFRPNNIQRLKVFPNPTKDYTEIKIPETLNGDFYLTLTNSEGVKINSSYQKMNDAIQLNLSDLSKGFYVVWIRDENENVYVGKIVVIR